MTGRYPDAIWTPSPNYSKGRVGVVDRVVLHQTDGQPLLHRCVEHLCNADSEHHVSAHFVVGQLGEVVQLVDLDDTAWHCSGWNAHSFGIEHVARTPRELNAKDVGLPLTAVQLEASARLVKWLLGEFKLSVGAVVPHCSSPTTTHKDCGRADVDGGIWPWTWYISRIERKDADAK